MKLYQNADIGTSASETLVDFFKTKPVIYQILPPSPSQHDPLYLTLSQTDRRSNQFLPVIIV